MFILRTLVSPCVIVAGAVVIFTADASAATVTFPTKPIRILTAGIGGSADYVARLIAQGLSANLNQQVIVDNRPNGVVPNEIVAKSSPDGYTLLVSANSLWIGQLIAKSTPYDVLKDFTPITLATRSPNVLLVNPNFGINSVKDLIAAAKAKPGQLNYGSGAIGASSHLAAELLKAMTNINLVRIPYKSNSAQMTDLIGGQIQVMFSNATAAPPQMKSGRLKGLAVTSAQASPLLPELPPVSATVPGYASEGVSAVFGPANLPSSLVRMLNREIIKVLQQPEIKDKFYSAGVEPLGSSPAELDTFMRAEMKRWTKIIKDTGITED